MFIKYLDQSIRDTKLLNSILGLTISEARIMILLLFWVGGGWVGEINNKDQLSPIEIETGTEFGNFKPQYMISLSTG